MNDFLSLSNQIVILIPRIRDILDTYLVDRETLSCNYSAF